MFKLDSERLDLGTPATNLYFKLNCFITKLQTRLCITTMLSPTLCYIHPLPAMSVGIQAEAFPDTTLSVLDFLQFPLPVISGAAS
jgi:hypothetical protein